MRNKNVIYTCITGGYDVLMEPEEISSGFDYVCYTDNTALTSDTWQIRAIPDKLSGLSNKEKNRYIKINAHELLQEYDLSIYVDGNVKLKKDISAFVNSKCLDGNVFLYKHHIRDCIYDEMNAVVECWMARREEVDKIKETFLAEGFPEKFGLSENTVMIRHHNDKGCKKIMEEWWEGYKNIIQRDQVVLFYVLWKNGFLKNGKNDLGDTIYFNGKNKVVLLNETLTNNGGFFQVMWGHKKTEK